MKGSTKWYLQRFTSLTLVPISYWFVIFFLNNLNLSSENFVNSLDSNFVKLLIIIFFCMKGSTKWYLQRFTSLTLVPISYWFVIFFLNNLNLSSENFVNSLDSNFVKLLIIIFFCVAVFHTRLNLLTIYEDYFNDNQVRLYSRLTDSVLLLILLFILPIIFI